MGELHELVETGVLGEADDPEVTAMNSQYRGCRRADRAFVISEPGFVGRADLAKMAPDASKISGSRKLPPISTSCPRETITSRPAARAFKASTVAPALLFTAVAASAPVSSLSSRAIPPVRRPRVPSSRSSSRLQ